MHGLEVIHAKRIPTHGGSIRVMRHARASARSAERCASCCRGASEPAAPTTAGRDFRRRVVHPSSTSRAAARGEARRALVYGVGAPSRASTLVNYVGLDDAILDCVLEIKGSYKIGKYMPGTLIPVLDEQKLFEDQPEYALLLSWHIGDELAAKLGARVPRQVRHAAAEPRVVGRSWSVSDPLRPGPLVSVVVCTKNGMPYVREAMASPRAPDVSPLRGHRPGRRVHGTARRSSCRDWPSRAAGGRLGARRRDRRCV